MHIEQIHKNTDAYTMCSGKRVTCFLYSDDGTVRRTDGNACICGDNPFWSTEEMARQPCNQKHENCQWPVVQNCKKKSGKTA